MAKKTASQAEQLLATSGAAMRQLREKGVVLTFPSGYSYRVCMPGAAGMLKRGNLPNPLLAFVVDAFYNGMTPEKYQTFLSAKDRAEDVLATLDALKVVCEAMFMEPRIVDEPQSDDECTIDDVPIDDREWAFRMMFYPVKEVHPFRGEQKVDVASVPETQDVSREAERHS
jgi:hypothetical protein